MHDIEETGFIDIEVMTFAYHTLPYGVSDQIEDHLKKAAQEKYGEMKYIGQWKIIENMGNKRVWFKFIRYNEYDILCQQWENLLGIPVRP